MKVYSFSLFGDRSAYFMKFLPSIIRAFYCLYDIRDGWSIRIYHDTQSMQQKNFNILQGYADKQLISLQHVSESYPLAKSMLMRMMAIWDESIDICVFRDLDYLPTYRERQMLETFIKSNATFHTVSDHECHLCPIMGGMIAVKNKDFINYVGIHDWQAFVGKEPETYFSNYGKDQEYMTNYYWELLRPVACEHRLAGLKPANCLYSYTTIADIDLPVDDTVKKHGNSFGCCIGGYTSDSERQRAVDIYEKNLDENIRQLIIASETFYA